MQKLLLCFLMPLRNFSLTLKQHFLHEPCFSRYNAVQGVARFPGGAPDATNNSTCPCGQLWQECKFLFPHNFHKGLSKQALKPGFILNLS